jgi:riboflavin synthase
MFTGLIEAVCRVTSAREVAGAVQLTVDLGKSGDGTKIGDSVAINGACLTVIKLQAGRATFDLSGETLAKSALGKLKPGSAVNVERALRPSDRMGGHIVQGHLDGTAAIKAIHRHGQFANIRFAVAAELLDQMVSKGSVAVDGISLTIADMDQNGFSVAVIPQTLDGTTLGSAKVGDTVNIEIDVITKIVKKQLEIILPQPEKLTVERLRQLGF